MIMLSGEQQAALVKEIERGSFAYVRNLAAAEEAVRRGQFNVAKVLRATANAQRTIALNAARLLEAATTPTAIAMLAANLVEQKPLLAYSDTIVDQGVVEQGSKLETFVNRSTTVHARVADLLQRSLDNLAEQPDILESVVHTWLFVCLVCGNLVKEKRPTHCDLCGALNSELFYVGPFYSGTSERLGRLAPPELLAILEESPAQVERLLADVDDEALRRKPSPDEWCIKELVAHILETDYMCVAQVESILTQSHFDSAIAPWKTHLGKGYEEKTKSELMEQFVAARNGTLALLRQLTPADWSKSYYIWEQSISILDTGTWHANHDIGHIAQIRRLLAAWQVQAA